MARTAKSNHRISSKGLRTVTALAATALFATTLPLTGIAGLSLAAEVKGGGAPAVRPGRIQAQSLKAVERGLRLINEEEARLARKSDPKAAGSLAQQRLNLETTRQIIEYQAKRREKSSSGVLGAARLAIVRQAASLGIRIPAAGAALDELSPSQAAVELAARHEIVLSQVEKRNLADLDKLPNPLKKALGKYMSSFLAYDRAARDAFWNFDPDNRDEVLRQMEQLMSDEAARNSAASMESGAAVDKTVLSPAGGLHMPALGRILSARLSMLVTGEELVDAIRANPIKGPRLETDSEDPVGKSPGKTASPEPQTSQPDKSAGNPAQRTKDGQSPAGSGVAPAPAKPLPSQSVPGPVNEGTLETPEPPVPLALASHDPLPHDCRSDIPGEAMGISPLLCIDLRQAYDNTYVETYALQIDAGGNDCYLNNAGGSSVLTPPKTTPVTNCREKLDAYEGRYSGAGAAALLDLAGNDQYKSSNYAGANGGGSQGAGSLVDLGSGDDLYRAEARTEFELGGINGGGDLQGSGFLLDEDGDDLYDITAKKVTTPTSPSSGCSEGCPPWGTNGGAARQGTGFLFDGAGNDTYQIADPVPQELCSILGGFHCSMYGANGGAGFGGSAALLVDLGGADTYRAGKGGTNGGSHQTGRGFLLDVAGDDAYSATDEGVNGGAWGVEPGPPQDLALLKPPANPTDPRQAIGHAFTAFQAPSFGTTQVCYLRGCSNGGTGFLFDADGGDRYVGGQKGSNGGGDAILAGFLIDAGGFDLYQDKSGPRPQGDGYPSGSGWDKTVLPKGDGAQIDENGSSADLEVSQSDSPDPVPTGRNLTYAITVANKGLEPENKIQGGEQDPSKACGSDPPKPVASRDPPMQPCNTPRVHAGDNVGYDVVLTDNLPAGANFTSADSSCSYDKPDHRVTCLLGDLEEGETVPVEIVVTPHNEPGDTIFNRVSVASSPSDPNRSTSDPNPDNNEDKIDTKVGEPQAITAVSIGDAAPVKEGDSGAQATAAFKVSLSEPADSEVTVAYATRDETASAENDYEKADRVIRFQPGETSQIISVPINGDVTNEAAETFSVRLSRPTNAMVDQGQGLATILDDDPLPDLSINDVAVGETDLGALAELSVSLTSPSGQAVSVDYSTEDGTATVADQDYEAKSGILNFAPGETKQSVKIGVLGDPWAEPDETFFVNVSNPKNVAIKRGQGRATILNEHDTRKRPSSDNSPYHGQIVDDSSYRYRDGRRSSGGVFVSGHDADDHAAWAMYRGASGAQRIVQTAVKYVTGGKTSPRLLYVTSDIARATFTSEPPPSGEPTLADEAGQNPEKPPVEVYAGRNNVLPRGMTASGFTYDLAASDLSSSVEPAAHDLRTVRFSDYDAVVVGCVDGCGLTQAELDILNERTADIMNYVNRGGGLVAFEEAGLQNQFKFLPFLEASNDVIQEEAGFKATSFGKSLGLTDEDVSGNISHNVFLNESGLGVVDVDGQGRIVSLATKKLINERGAIGDEPDHELQPQHQDEGMPRPISETALKAAPVFRGDVVNQLPPPAQPAARPEQGVVRHSFGQHMPQTAAQTQAQLQLQTQFQAQQQAQSQNAMQVQVQAAPAKQQERQGQVLLAKAEAGREQSQESRRPSKAREHLATARQPVSPAGAALGGISALTLAMLALIRPKKQKMPKAATAARTTGTRGTALQRPQPRHRKH